MQTITEDFCFNPQRKHSILLSQKAFSLYVEKFEEDPINNLLEGLPIFLDTNVILGYYGMAQKEKDKLYAFLQEQKERIILTRRVEEEFLKNRISCIRKDFFKPLNEMAAEYAKMKNDILNSLQSFKDKKRKILENDFIAIWEKLQKFEADVKQMLEEEAIEQDIKMLVDHTTKENTNIELVDKLIDLCSQFKVLEPLDDSELALVISQYDQLSNTYKNTKEEQRKLISFPGCGERKPDGREGDFIIFHEIMKFMKNTNTSCLFLTNDIKKADWLQDDYRPFPHYIENTYFLTKQVMLIFHAESALRNINFENVHSANIDSESEEDIIENEDGFGEEYNLGFTASEHLMRLVLTKGSFESNLRNNVYYHPENRGFRGHKYIGLYLNKSIKAIGKISNIITADLDETNNLVVISSKLPVTNKEEQQIKNAIKEGFDLGWDASRGSIFFCVDNFFPTNFKKISAYAPMGTKFFDLRQVLNVKEIELETSEIAKLLDGKEWI